MAVNGVENGVQDKDWWKKTIIYQIYPRSFQDSNGDGIGDLKGIQSRLDHFQNIFVETLWLSPIYTSPMVDFGYDVSNFIDIDPIFGTLKDFDELLAEMHKRDMKLVLDFIPNHSSDQHEWFIESRKGGDNNPYKDFYVWHDGKQNPDGSRSPPNNWLGIFGGSAWEWVEDRKQYYLHQFSIEQPDLNYRNPAVRQKMMDALKFWMDRGVDGFRVDAIGFLIESENFEDEPLNEVPGFKEDESDYLKHIYTQHLDENHEVVSEWRAMMDKFEEKTGKHIFMVMEVYANSLDVPMKYYNSGADLPFNFGLVFVNEWTGGSCVKGIIQSWLDLMPEGKWPNFVIGNHDQKRSTSTKGILFTNVMNMLLLTLPGTPTTYYGEEIGLRDVEVTYDETQDPYGKNMGPDLCKKYSRDPCRGPMQWTDEENAGFTSAEKSWLPVHPDYKERNVKVQENDATFNEPLPIYRQLAELRRDKHFQNAWLDYVVVNDNILSYVRGSDNKPAYLIGLNLGGVKSIDNYSRTECDVNFTEGEIIVTTGHMADTHLVRGEIVDLTNLVLNAGDGFVAKLIIQEKTDPEKK